MRNVIFANKPAPAVRRGRPSTVAPSIMTDGEDSYMGDIDSRPASPHARARAVASKKVETLAAQVARRIGPTVQRKWQAEQTEDALVELIARLSDIRANSDPKVFEELWQANIMRVEELEEEGTTEEAEATGLSHHNYTARSNEPFNTSGAPVANSFPSSLTLAPTLPSLMSAYISVVRAVSRKDWPLVSHSAAAPMTQSYHWPSAPVENHDFTHFFTGINYRIDVAPSSIMG